MQPDITGVLRGAHNAVTAALRLSQALPAVALTLRLAAHCNEAQGRATHCMDVLPLLADELAKLKAAAQARATPERIAMIDRAIARLKVEGGIEALALKQGQLAPDVALPDVGGRRVRLRDMWRTGPLVVVFYRGAWCPYCNLQLRAWHGHLDALREHHASLVAISPQMPDLATSGAPKNPLGFTVLSDSTLEAAEAFRIAFTLPSELIDLYGRLGNDLPVLNGNGRWALPMTATYLIDTRGQIVYAHVDADYRERAEPAAVLSRLASITRSVP
jgi:peroxiredoxin